MVYAVICRRKHVYVGSTGRDIRKRASEHRYNVRNRRAAPGQHWALCNQLESDWTFILLAHEPNEEARKRLEAQFRRTLDCTYGRN